MQVGRWWKQPLVQNLINERKQFLAKLRKLGGVQVDWLYRGDKDGVNVLEDGNSKRMKLSERLVDVLEAQSLEGDKRAMELLKDWNLLTFKEDSDGLDSLSIMELQERLLNCFKDIGKLLCDYINNETLKFKIEDWITEFRELSDAWRVGKGKGVTDIDKEVGAVDGVMAQA
jgi:hypothetical protein